MMLQKSAYSLFLGLVLTFSSSSFAELKKVPAPNLAPSAAIAGPSDSEILHIFVTTNSVGVDASGVAQSRSKNKDVLSFSKSVIAELGSLNSEVTALAKKSGTRPTSGLNSQALTDQARKTVNTLKTLEGKPFDETYLTSIITSLEKAAGQLEDNLLPNVKSADIKAVLIKGRTVYGPLVGKAKKILAELPK